MESSVNTYSHQSSIYNSDDISHMMDNGKFNGMIKTPLLKRLRAELFIVTTYIENVVSRLFPMHYFITFIRIFQLYCPSILSSYTSVHPKGSLIYKTMGYISIIAHLVLPSERNDWVLVIIYGYCSLNLVFMCLLIGSSHYYSNNAKLPVVVCSIINIYIGTFGYISHPIVAQAIFELIGKKTIDYQMEFSPYFIFGSLFSFVIFLIYIWIMYNVTTIRLQFKPDSLMSIQSKPVVFNVVYVVLLTSILSFGSYLSKSYQLVIIGLSCVLYLVYLWYLFQGTSFINDFHQILISSFVLSSILNCLLFCYLLKTNRTTNDAFVFYLVFITFIAYYLVSWFRKYKNNKNNEILDYIENDKEYFDSIKSVNHFLNICVSGFQVAHPICINWMLFQYANEVWDKNIDILSVFAKFVAIYPEESKKLEWIQKTIISNKHKGSVAKFTVLQINSILRQRESNLSPYLKKRIGDIHKLTQVAKNRIRNVWDLVVQGSINEMENAIDIASIAVEKVQMEFFHLQTVFPNNRFVARPYAFFLKEIKADYEGFSEWMDKIKTLKRGILITSDNTHDLGILAFPHLPDYIGNLSKNSVDNDFSAQIEIEIEDDSVSTSVDVFSYIKKRINSVPISSTRNSILISLLLLFVVLVPSIYLLLRVFTFLDDLSQPLEFMHALSYMRCLNFQMSALGIRWIMEVLPIENSSIPLFETIDYGDYRPLSLGGITDTREQLRYLLRIAPGIVQKANLFRSYEVGNPTLDIVRSFCFSASIAFTFHNNAFDYYDTLLSAQEILMGSVLHLSNFINSNPISSLLNTPSILNPINNVHTAGIGMSEAILTLIDYLSIKNENIQFNVTYILYISVLMTVSLYIIALSENIYSVSHQKLEIYRSIASMPKNVVGSIVESLRTIKKDGTELSKSTDIDSELNKQEENILKVFNSASDSFIGTNSAQGTQSIVVFLIIFSCLYNFYMISSIYKNASSLLRQYAPHIDNLLGTSAYIYGQFTALKCTVLSLMGYKEIDPEPFYMNRRVYQRHSLFRQFNNRLKYGSETGETPYAKIFNGLEKSKQYIKCRDKSAVPNSTIEILSCYDADFDIMLFDSLVLRILHPYQVGVDTIRSRGDLVSEAYFIGSIVVFDSYLYPMFDSIISNLKNEIRDKIGSSIMVAMVLFSIVTILHILLIIQANKSKYHMKYALSLILHCPASSISQSTKIISILSGDFSSKGFDITSRNSSFFQSVIDNLPDSIMLTDQKGIIISMNRAFLKYFGQSLSNLISENVSGFICRERFGDVFDQICPSNKKADEIHISYKVSSDELCNFCVSINSTNSYIIYTFKDETRAINYGNLIRDERSKSDKMLASILPASLVPKVQAGETNISFAVQTASILFIDIVEFTPWCSSNSSSRVMSVLNTIFREFDSLLPMFPTMTKIKCIGDCYMAAGGIFCETNQPAKHAKETVDFGLEAIKVINKVNELMGESLKIRVGVNTGGPIIAGVLGTAKPTFEILGKPINMAQQMEHHGIPMSVHISRPVYELIYGGSHRIKERGQINIKNGQVFTYLVSP